MSKETKVHRYLLHQGTICLRDGLVVPEDPTQVPEGANSIKAGSNTNPVYVLAAEDLVARVGESSVTLVNEHGLPLAGPNGRDVKEVWYPQASIKQTFRRTL